MTAPSKLDRPVLFRGPLVRAILRDVDPKTQTRRLATTLRVVPRRDVSSDFPQIEMLTARAGRRYPAKINPLGAVSCDVGNGRWLGLRPGEFDFVCPYADGRTYRDDEKWHIDVAAESRLWVRETHAIKAQCVAYDADGWCGAICDDSGGGRLRIPHGRIVDAKTSERGPWPEGGARSFGLDGYGGRWRPSIHMPRWASRITLAVEHIRLEHVQDITEADARAEGVEPATISRSFAYRDGFADLWDEINGPRGWGWVANPWVWAVTFRLVTRG